jgi:CRISP-associated protein Cas1
MAVLYITEEGSVLRKRDERLVVEKDGKELMEVELRRLTAVLMLDSVQVTTQALVQLLKFGVEFAILSRAGKLLGQLTPPFGRNILVRKAQFRKETDEAFALTQSKEIVSAKIHNSIQVLIRYMWDTSRHPNIQESVSKMEETAKKVPTCMDNASLLGLEGCAAALYWRAFGEMMKAPDVVFNGREKHPPPDPINAVLSFGYVLLSNALQSLLDGMGFDPFLGFYHEEDYGRPSLALYLLEPLRAPVVDRFTVRTFNLGILKAQDFEADPEGGVRLTREALRIFFKNWEQHLGKMAIRQVIQEQAEQLSRVFMDEEALVKPWLWKARE